jgi:phage tail protein X
VTVSPSSRYLSNPIVLLPDPSGMARQVITSTPPEAVVITYTSYLVQGDDRIDSLAQSFYGDSTMWWAFANANPEIMDWSNLESGTIIRVPNV